MKSLCYAIDLHHILPPLLHREPPLLPTLEFKTITVRNRCRIIACALHPKATAATAEIDMVRNKEGVFTAKPKKVPQQFGDVVDLSAYANRHAFIHLPQWVQEERRERRRLDILERKGIATPSELYVCGVCGRKCKTNLDLKKHFKQLHERERQKKLGRMRSLKGKKRQRFKERFIDGNDKYREAAKTLVTPKVGYGLAAELRRAGVFVKMVADKPQAADWAVKRQMQHSMTRGIDWIVLVSDDSDFEDMLRKARGANLGTVVVGDMDRALGRHADLWVPWIGVENGEVSGEDLLARRRNGVLDDDDDDSVSVMEFGGGGKIDSVLDELVGNRTDHWRIKERESNTRFQIRQFLDDDDDDDDDGEEDAFLSDSEDEGT